jgi:hypothetical protein
VQGHGSSHSQKIASAIFCGPPRHLGPQREGRVTLINAARPDNKPKSSQPSQLVPAPASVLLISITGSRRWEDWGASVQRRKCGDVVPALLARYSPRHQQIFPCALPFSRSASLRYIHVKCLNLTRSLPVCHCFFVQHLLPPARNGGRSIAASDVEALLCPERCCRLLIDLHRATATLVSNPGRLQLQLGNCERCNSCLPTLCSLCLCLCLSPPLSLFLSLCLSLSRSVTVCLPIRLSDLLSVVSVRSVV